MRAALTLLGALAGFLVGLALFSVSYEAWIVAAPLAAVGCVACVWVMAKAPLKVEEKPGEDRRVKDRKEVGV